ncbi:hypothetical protein PSH03_002766 [Micromonospora sp. PSH03]|uniref:hypothetical protein n=1 Tax=Micromonospora TaxID=1873 RepID=UPI001B37A183|nr:MULTISPECIES: hypothetical protein [Micromonospora]MBQ0989529.1 hypothetical protein [Micromonospora sp. H61]MCG5457652.1 hypothetical protein [Micromonospora salmantinae]
MRGNLLVGAMLTLTFVAGCTSPLKRVGGDAGPAGSPSTSESRPSPSASSAPGAGSAWPVILGDDSSPLGDRVMTFVSYRVVGEDVQATVRKLDGGTETRRWRRADGSGNWERCGVVERCSSDRWLYIMHTSPGRAARPQPLVRTTSCWVARVIAT